MSVLRRRLLLSQKPRSLTLPQYLTYNAPILLEDFESLTPWTIAGSYDDVSLDAINMRSGSCAIKITPAIGASPSLTRIVSWDFGGQAPDMRIHLYAHGAVYPTGLYVSLTSDAGWSRYMFWSSGTSPATIGAGWNCLDISRNSWISINSESWGNTMIRLRVQPVTAVGTQPISSIDTLWGNMRMQPTVLLMFDDGDKSVYTQAFAYMRRRRIRATAYIITNQIGDTGKLTLDELSALYAAGWDIGNHTMTHPDLTLLSPAEQAAELTGAKNQIDSWKFPRASGHVAYPGGAHDDTVLSTMASEGMSTGRTILSLPQLAVPWGQAYTLSTSLNVINTTSLATVKAAIDSAITGSYRNRCVSLLFHSIVETPTVSTQWSIANFQGLIDHLVQRRNDIVPITISDFYSLASRSVNVPRVE